jgi:hypothetical protein
MGDAERAIEARSASLCFEPAQGLPRMRGADNSMSNPPRTREA